MSVSSIDFGKNWIANNPINHIQRLTNHDDDDDDDYRNQGAIRSLRRMRSHLLYWGGTLQGNTEWSGMEMCWLRQRLRRPRRQRQRRRARQMRGCPKMRLLLGRCDWWRQRRFKRCDWRFWELLLKIDTIYSLGRWFDPFFFIQLIINLDLVKW